MLNIIKSEYNLILQDQLSHRQSFRKNDVMMILCPCGTFIRSKDFKTHSMTDFQHHLHVLDIYNKSKDDDHKNILRI